MTHVISISDLKANPARAIRDSQDFPVEIKKRNNTQAYLMGKDLYERLVDYLEDQIDIHAVETADFSKGKDLDEVIEELGLKI